MEFLLHEFTFSMRYFVLLLQNIIFSGTVIITFVRIDNTMNFRLTELLQKATFSEENVHVLTAESLLLKYLK